MQSPELLGEVRILLECIRQAEEVRDIFSNTFFPEHCAEILEQARRVDALLNGLPIEKPKKRRRRS